MIKIEVSTHDGEVYTTEVEEYDAAKTNEMTNDNSLNTVVLGDIVISRINVKSIVPRKFDESETSA